MKDDNNNVPSRKRQVQAFLKKLLYSALVMGAACYTFFFFAPFEMLAGGSNAMSYTHRDVWHILALTAVIVFSLVTPVLLALRGKVFRITLTLFFSLTLCCYLQCLLMNRSLGVLNGDSYSVTAGTAILDLFLWLAIFVGCFFALSKSRKVWRGILLYGAIALLVMQGASTVSLALQDPPTNASIAEYQLSTENMYSYSSGDNVFVFVLDRLDYNYIEKVKKQDPEFFDELDGFTCYTNAMSAYARTQPALNHLLTGSETAYSVSAQQFFTDSWTEDGKDLLGGLQEQGYSVELYTKPTYLFGSADYAVKNVDNLTNGSQLRDMAVFPKLLRMAAYRCAPNVLKGLFWADTNFYNHQVFASDGTTGYDFDDPAYAPGFVTATADSTENSFKFYHFNGSHSPYNMRADGTAAAGDEAVTVEDQTMGSFRNLYRAFSQMKALGIYEDATIIITADHGAAMSDRLSITEIVEKYQKVPQIGLFYKPSGSAGTPLAYSDAPVSTDNIPATIAKAAGFEDITPYGTALEDVAEDAAVTRPYFKTVTPKGSGWETGVYEYAVTGDVSDFDNWQEITVTEDLPEENSFY